MKYFFAIALAASLTACDRQESAPVTTDTAAVDVSTAAKITPPVATQASLDEILAAQSEETKARYQYRHPKETLEFFGIKPGMTVVELLPGDGWYSQILVPYLGQEGRLIGVDYDIDLWSKFDWAKPEFIESRKKWPDEFTEKAKTWAGDHGADTSAYLLSDVPEDLNGKVDAVLFIRALHNFSRFENQGSHLTQMLAKTKDLLKPGGTVGIVQHQASEDRDDAWADGSRGYLKKSAVIAQMEKAGFELVAESAINENAADVPGDDDIVWRLPPGLYTSQDNAELRQQYQQIGESNRMTLLFRKPE